MPSVAPPARPAAKQPKPSFWPKLPASASVSPRPGEKASATISSSMPATSSGECRSNRPVFSSITVMSSSAADGAVATRWAKSTSLLFISSPKIYGTWFPSPSLHFIASSIFSRNARAAPSAKSTARPGARWPARAMAHQTASASIAVANKAAARPAPCVATEPGRLQITMSS